MDNLFWCDDANSFYLYSLNELSNSDTTTLTISDFYQNAQRILESYLLNGCNRLVLIKTSVTGKRNANHEVTSDLLEFVLKFSRKTLPHAKIVLADGPAYARSFLEECKRLDWVRIAHQYNVKILDLNRDNYHLLEGKWPISDLWNSADKIINLCKAKTHKRFGVTLSNKNMLGVFSGAVLGYPKFTYSHLYIPRLLWKLDSLTIPRLNIIDGVNGIQGNGPMKGRPSKSNFLVVGTNSYCCDFQATLEMGFAPCVTIGCMRPFYYDNMINKSRMLAADDIIRYRKTFIDYFPNFSNSWMYKTAYDEPNELNNRYQIISRGVQECWTKRK